MTKTKIYAGLCALGGLMIGGFAAIIESGGHLSQTDQTGAVVGGTWVTDFEIGSVEASGALRARIARKGLFALRRTEAVYYTRSVDHEGQTLRSNCIYHVAGSGLPAEWWSVTLYDEHSMLADNIDDAASVNKDEIIMENGAWLAVISNQRSEAAKNWISSNGSTTFDLTLRLYRPDLPYLMSGDASGFPNIERISCDKGEGA